MSLPDSPSQAQDLDHCDYMHVHVEISGIEPLTS